MDLLKEAELYMERNCIERAISDAVSDAVAARDPDPMAFIADRLLQWQPHPVRAALDACHPARDALVSAVDNVPNCYSFVSGAFSLSWTERGVAYGESDQTELTASATIQLGARPVVAPFETRLVERPVCVGGVNWAAALIVTPRGGAASLRVLLPGTRTYDPAGRSGDPHACASSRTLPAHRSASACAARLFLSLCHSPRAVLTARSASATRAARRRPL